MKKQISKQEQIDNLCKYRDIIFIRLEQLNNLKTELNRIYNAYYKSIDKHLNNKPILESMFLCNLSYRINTEFSQYIINKLKVKEEIKKYRMRIVLAGARWNRTDYIHRLMFVEDLIKEESRNSLRLSDKINKLLHN